MTDLEIIKRCFPGVIVEQEGEDEHGPVIYIDMAIGIFRKPMKIKTIAKETDHLGYEVVVCDHEGNEVFGSEHRFLNDAILTAGAEYFKQVLIRRLDDISTEQYAKQLEQEKALLGKHYWDSSLNHHGKLNQSSDR